MWRLFPVIQAWTDKGLDSLSLVAEDLGHVDRSETFRTNINKIRVVFVGNERRR